MQVYMGIDWSTTKHDVCFINEKGGIISQISVPSNENGFERMHKERCKLVSEAGQIMVGIETSHNLLLDYLVGQGYEQIYVIPPAMVKSSRGRFGAGQACTDRSDAHLIADMLRTDQARLCQWQPDRPLTQRIKARVSLIHYLTKGITRTANRLRDVLNRYYPQAVNVFSKLDKLIAIKFIERFPTPQAAQTLSYEAFIDFARQNRYPRPALLAACYARLQEPYPEMLPEVADIYGDEAVLLAAELNRMVGNKKRQLKQLVGDFEQHPDAFVFNALPGAGDFLAPALLSKFGDDRSRYPTRESVQAVAGTCPVTQASGKRKQVLFRKACDREFRTFAQQWARSSLTFSPWANAYFHSVRPRCGSKSHAYRCLANRWIAIAWRLWQDRSIYDEAYHLRQRSLRSKLIFP